MIAHKVVDMFEEKLSKLKPVADDPEEENIQFNFEKQAENIVVFLTNPNVPWPFTIGIHGEWGSGKTTLLKIIKKKLTDKKTNLKMIEFSAWEYEKIDIFASLLQCIEHEFNNRNKTLRDAILSFGADIFLRNMISMSKNEAIAHFKSLIEKRKTFRSKLNKLVDDKLVIFIDDLDRCEPENTLSMLENIKFFLTIKNIVIVIAVDMDKIERSWELKYGSIDAKTIGRDHAEKMFQLKISVPHKSEDDLNKYVQHMAASIRGHHIEHFVKSMPSNPRKMKLALNLIYFVLNSSRNLQLDQKVNPDMYLHTLITWISIMSNHRSIAEIAEKYPSYLVYAAFICSRFKHLSKFKKVMISNAGNTNGLMAGQYAVIDNDFMNSSILRILEIATDDDQAAFRTLRSYGIQFRLDYDPTNYIYISKDHEQKFVPFYLLLKKIIETVPM